MLYLNKSDILEIGVDWDREIDVIENAVNRIAEKDFSQPVKPYLRFRNSANRIIAMPAYVGGEFDVAGIKWIASFPKNIEKAIPRANSITILNNAETGQPIGIINTSLISAIRTAAVSGSLVRLFDKKNNYKNLSVGIIGFGPIGQIHLEMLTSLLGNRLLKVYLYDLAGIDSNNIPHLLNKLEVCNSWQEVYANADIFVTCTVSKSGYIDLKPKDNSLILNVSLRDFKPEILSYTKSIIVDNWEEVCREDTDIEQMHLKKSLKKEQTRSLIDVINRQELDFVNPNDAIMLNPMGMAVFDVAMAYNYYNLALNRDIGIHLDD